MELVFHVHQFIKTVFLALMYQLVVIVVLPIFLILETVLSVLQVALSVIALHVSVVVLAFSSTTMHVTFVLLVARNAQP